MTPTQRALMLMNADMLAMLNRAMTDAGMLVPVELSVVNTERLERLIAAVRAETEKAENSGEWAR